MVSWGGRGPKESTVHWRERIDDVLETAFNGNDGYAAVSKNGDVTMWGTCSRMNYECRVVLEGKIPVSIKGTRWDTSQRYGTFACLCDDDTVVCWGSTDVLPDGFQIVRLQ